MSGAHSPPGQLPVTSDSEEALRYFKAGRMMAFQYQPSRAIPLLDAAIAADPGFVLAHLHRGGMSPNGERGPFFEQARIHRDRVTADENLMIDAFHAFLWDRRFQEAISIFAELADRYEGDPYLPTYLGLRYWNNLGRPDLAREQFERAHRRDPGWAPAYLWLGQAALREGDLDQAEKRFGQYFDLAPNEPRAHDCRGLLQLRQGRHTEAEDSFEKALALDPDFSDSRKHLVAMAIERKLLDLEEAVATGDANAIEDKYHPVARVSLPDSTRLEGPGPVSEFWTRAPTRLKLETTELYLGLDRDVVTELGSYQLGDGPDSTGTHMTVWVMTVTGWRIYRSVWTSD